MQPSLLMKLASITIETDGQMEDQVGWLKPRNNNFTVALAYKLLTGKNKEGRWGGWLKIWRLKVQRRVKVFVWLVAHDRVLTTGRDGGEA